MEQAATERALLAARRALGIPVNQENTAMKAPASAGAQNSNVKVPTLAKQKSKEVDDFQNVGAVSMETSNQDFVSELIAQAKEESRMRDDSQPFEIDHDAVKKVTDRLVKQGFQHDQVREALHRCGETEYETLLDDLILNTPDSELPAKFRHALSSAHKKAPTLTIMRPNDPRTPIPDSTFASAAQTPRTSTSEVQPVQMLSMRDESSIASLRALGFSRDACRDALTSACGDVDSALRRLCAALYPADCVGPAAAIGPPDGCTDEAVEEARFDERTALEHIYGDDLVREIWFTVGVVVGVEVALEEAGVALTVRYDSPNLYPWQAPYLLLTARARPGDKGGLSPEDCVELTRQLAGEAVGMVGGTGMPVVFDLCSRAEELAQALRDGRAERERAARAAAAPPPAERAGKAKRDGQGGQGAKGAQVLVPREGEALVAGKKITVTQKEMYTVAAARTKQKAEAEAEAEARRQAEAEARAALARKLCAEAQARVCVCLCVCLCARACTCARYCKCLIACACVRVSSCCGGGRRTRAGPDAFACPSPFHSLPRSFAPSLPLSLSLFNSLS